MKRNAKQKEYNLRKHNVTQIVKCILLDQFGLEYCENINSAYKNSLENNW